MDHPTDLHEWLTFGVEFSKAVAWPIAVAIMAWPLKKLLAEVLRFPNREVNVEGFGVKAKIGPAEQQRSTEENPAKPETPVALPPPLPEPSVAVKVLEDSMRANLPSNQTPSQQNEYLLRLLADTRIRAGHEFVYNRIFGSQIAALKALDENGGATVAEARVFFEPYAKQFPQVYDTYGFEGWLGFLTANALVLQTDEWLTASEYGHDFLVYLRTARLTEAKAF
jgi:hypothetical protein